MRGQNQSEECDVWDLESREAGRRPCEDQSPRGCNGNDPRGNCLNYKGIMTLTLRLLHLDKLLERPPLIWSIHPKVL